MIVHQRIRQGGFTLIEIAIVIFIVGLLLAGLIAAVGPQIEARDRRQTQLAIEDARVALYGFAMANGRLPCPDTSGDGVEDCTPMAERGWLPWATLGLNASGDAWGNRFMYRVATQAASVDCAYIRTTGGNIDVWTRGDDPTTSGVVEGKFRYRAGHNLPAVVWSHGRNGYGGKPVDGSPVRSGPPGWDTTDEGRNTADLPALTTRLPVRGNAGSCSDTDEAQPFCEYDDLVSWLSPAVLYYDYVTAGLCPK